jgi:hypothetical protein
MPGSKVLHDTNAGPVDWAFAVAAVRRIAFPVPALPQVRQDWPAPDLNSVLALHFVREFCCSSRPAGT